VPRLGKQVLFEQVECRSDRPATTRPSSTASVGMPRSITQIRCVLPYWLSKRSRKRAIWPRPRCCLGAPHRQRQFFRRDYQRDHRPHPIQPPLSRVAIAALVLLGTAGWLRKTCSSNRAAGPRSSRCNGSRQRPVECRLVVNVQKHRVRSQQIGTRCARAIGDTAIANLAKSAGRPPAQQKSPTIWSIALMVRQGGAASTGTHAF
jgi:hypothetical protein